MSKINVKTIELPHASGNSMSLAAPATNPSGDLTLTLPTNIGAAGKILAVNGSGNLDFIYPSGYGYFQAYPTGSNQSLSHNTTHTVEFGAETFDSQSWFNTSTYKYTPQVAGKYYIVAHLGFTAITDEKYQAFAGISKNDSGKESETYFGVDDNAYGYQTVISSTLVSLNGSSDYVIAKAIYYDSGSNGAQLRATSDETFMYGYLVEAD